MRKLLVAVVLVGAAAAVGYRLLDVGPGVERDDYPLRYSAIVRQEAREKGLDPALVAAVIYQESRFERDARSSAGAIGLMQLRPDTALGIAQRTGGTAFRLSDLENPAINIRYGSWYLRNLFAKYGNERIALAAYNAGQGNVDRWLSTNRRIEFAETREYVERVVELKRAYREAWRRELYRTS